MNPPYKETHFGVANFAPLNNQGLAEEGNGS